MAQINVQVNAIAFYDNAPSNNPQLRAFDLTLKSFGVQTANPDQRSYVIAPDEEKVIYDGTRNTAISNSTAVTVTKPDLTKNTYRFTATGTSIFRTDRASAIQNNTTVFQTTVNGPVLTFTATAGPFNTANIVIGDILNLEAGAGASSPNVGRFSIIAKTSNSVSVKNLDGAAETFTITDASKFMIYNNGGGVANQVQIGDTVVISSGFSPATYGSYEVIEVTPLWFEVNIGASNGIPLENSIVPTTSGLVFYNAAKQFVLITAQNTVSVRFNTDTSDNTLLEPIEADSAEKAGIFLKQGSFYKLVIKNVSLTPTTIIVASGD